MKFRRNKKGFTIVELIIVIAVIGILTAVMVPTIVHLVNKANKASDEALVSNLNKAVQLRYAETSKKPDTMYETVEGLREYGYNLDALVAKSDEHLLYSLKDNKFVLEGAEGVSGNEKNYWKIQKSVEAAQVSGAEGKKFNIYATDDFEFNVASIDVGFDAGNSNVSEVNYTSSTSDEVVIRTNKGDLNIEAPYGTVKHYGVGEELTITAVYPESYDEYGVFSSATLASGHIHVQEDGYIGTITAESGQKVTVDGSTDKVEGVAVEEASKGYVADNNGTGSKGDASKAGLGISNLEELKEFRDSVNNGSLKGVTARLVADIDISNEAWKPIGNISNPFYGTFEGNGHTIKGLTNAGYIIDTADIWTTDSTNHTGSAYGFFGLIGSKVGSENVTIKNIKFTDVNIDVSLSNAVAAVAGADTRAAKASANNSFAGNLTFTGIEVVGTLIKGEDSIGAIIGKSYTTGQILVRNCTTNISVQTNVLGKKIGGLVGFASLANSIIVKDNTVKGNVYFAGIKTASDITNARNYVNMTVVTGARFGKNFVFGPSVNTIEGKLYHGENEYLDPFTLSYTFDENGVATSATYNYIPIASRDSEKNYLDNNLIYFYDGSIVNGLFVNDGVNDNGKKDFVNTFGTVVMNNCTVYGTYNSEVGGNLTLNDCAGKRVSSKTNYGTGSVTASTGGMIVINNGNFTLDSSISNALSEGRSRITVTSGRFGDGYVASNLPSSIYAANQWCSQGSPLVHTHDNVTYTVTALGGNVWRVVAEPAA